MNRFGNFHNLGNNKGSTKIVIILFIVIPLFYNIRTILNKDSSDDKKEEVVKKQDTDKKENDSEKPNKLEKPDLNTSTEPKEDNAFTKDSEDLSTSLDETKPSKDVETSVSEKDKVKYVYNNPEVKAGYIPSYDGEQALSVNAGFANFNIDVFGSDFGFSTGWIDLSELDYLNRTQKVKAFITPNDISDKSEEIMLQNITPSGNVKNKDLVKTAIIPASFSNKNLSKTESYILAVPDVTKVLNKYFENVLDTVKSGNSILFEATPIYEGEDLIAKGIQLRAISYGSDELDFNVFIYNKSQGITIDYSKGNTLKGG